MTYANQCKWIRLVLMLVWCGWLGVSSARAQSAATLRELSKLHERIADPDKVLTAEDAKQAANRLAEWKLAPEKLAPEDRARLGRIEVYVALARGDAKAALERARSLLGEFPDDPATCEAAYLAACAAGDAQLGTDMLKQLAKGAQGDRRRQLSQRRRWMRAVGKQAPEVEIRTEDMTAFNTTRRGDRVLLIDFWNVRQTREDDTSEALRALYEEYQHSLHVDFVGVNADAEAQVPEAKEFAKESGYVWKQRYEYAATSAPLTHQAFHAGPPPWQVLIDTFGYVRAVGSVRAPGFRYALRAAIAEAGGDFEVLLPRTHDGIQPERPSAQVEPTGPRKPKSDQGDQELPSNLDAQAKLSQARAFLKAKNRSKAIELFREIVRDYPGTREAKEAQEYLDSLSP
jgi:tetratricopeptide (TPR) repeat protein